MMISPELKEEIVKIIDERIEEKYGIIRELKMLREAVIANSNAIKGLSESIDILTKRVGNLAEAQARTEERLNQLAEAQARTEERLNQLAENVDKLATAVSNLYKVHRRFAAEFYKWRAAYGFSLEDIARVVVPGWLYRHEGIDVDLRRKYFVINDKEVEVNLYGECVKDGEQIVVLGEVKSRIYGNDVKKFLKMLEDLKPFVKGKKVIPLMFGFLIHPTAVKMAENRDIRLIASYQR